MGSKTAKKKATYRRGPGKTFLVTGVFIAAVGVAFLSLTSMELAALVGGFSVLASLVYFDRIRRDHWERSVHFKFKTWDEKHAELGREISQNRDAIDDVRDGVRQVMRDVADIVVKSAKKEPETKPSATVFKAKSQDNSFAPDAMPRSIKPKRRPLTQASNPARKSLSSSRLQSANDSIDDMGRKDGQGLSDMVVRELLNHAMEEQRIDVFLQPIQRLPQRQTRFYEMYARIRAKPGVYIPAARYQDMAAKKGMMKDIDSLLLAQCLKILHGTARLPNTPPLFMNVTPKTLKNSAFMGRLVSFLGKNRDLTERLVLEIQHKDFIDMPVAVLQIMRGLGRLGVRFSIDHVESLDMDIVDLQRFHVKFVKAPAQMFLDALQSEKDYAAIWKYKRMLEGNGIGLVVEKIESEAQMRLLLDFDLHYGQGFLFGRPDLQGVYEPGFMRKRA